MSVIRFRSSVIFENHTIILIKISANRCSVVKGSRKIFFACFAKKYSATLITRSFVKIIWRGVR